MPTETELAQRIWDFCRETPDWLQKEAVLDIEQMLLDYGNQFMRKALDDGRIVRAPSVPEVR